MTYCVQSLATFATMSIAENIAGLKKQLPTGCRLIAVSKTHPPALIEEAYQAGHRLFGENKVQEMVAKAEALPKDIEWHLIGHLQTNKVKYIAGFVSMIHSVDSIKLLAEIDKQAKKADRIIFCLLQVHIAEEDTKFGFSAEEIFEALNAKIITGFSNIRVVGLMGMATFTDNTDQIRREFRSLRSLFDQLKEHEIEGRFEMTELSMGMSGDYKIAIEEGSTMVRVGSAIFGHRDYSKS